MIVRRHAANVTTVNLFWFIRDFSLLDLVRYSLLYLQLWWNGNLYMLLLCSGCFAVTFLILFQNYSCNYILQRRLLEMSIKLLHVCSSNLLKWSSRGHSSFVFQFDIDIQTLLLLYKTSIEVWRNWLLIFLYIVEILVY